MPPSDSRLVCPCEQQDAPQCKSFKDLFGLIESTIESEKTHT